MPEAIEPYPDGRNYALEQFDICELDRLNVLFEDFQPDCVIHLAAESHVDRSIDGPSEFIQTNIIGTYNLLEAARRYLDQMTDAKRDQFRFLHVSTDEVYGSLPLGAPGFREDHAYDPRSPYSASKASSDHLVRAWAETYGVPAIITNCSNNFGPWQFPEKLIPVMIINAYEQRPLPVYGAGKNVRDWLYVEDHARALWRVLEAGQVGETYNIGGNAERQNLEVVRQICAVLDQRFPARAPHERLIEFVSDRPGHDFRYAIDASKIRNRLGWEPQVDFEVGLAETIDWYLAREEWWRAIREKRYDGRRLGTASIVSAAE
jgi:dTDP-glucose 4,6-dehydratase